jgi:hypothetical protein
MENAKIQHANRQTANIVCQNNLALAKIMETQQELEHVLFLIMQRVNTAVSLPLQPQLPVHVRA